MTFLNKMPQPFSFTFEKFSDFPKKKEKKQF